MLLTFLLPPHLSTTSAHKFYALLDQELNELYYQGIEGGKLKGALIMVRSDQKGKEFDLGLRSCTSYEAPCYSCEKLAEPGIGEFTKTNVGKYRVFLPPEHPYRTDPRFGPPELDVAPAERNKDHSALGVQIVNENPLGSYYGYHELPLFSGVRYFRPFLQSAADLSHNIANFFKGVLLTLQPPPALVPRWRLEAQLSGRHPEIGPHVPQFLDVDVGNELRDLVLDDLRVAELKECAKIVGVQCSGTKEEIKTRLRQLLDTFRGKSDSDFLCSNSILPLPLNIIDTGSAVVSVGKGSIPWVLTPDQIEMVDSRCRRLVVPHHCQAFCTTKEGIFQSRSNCWRMVSKVKMFFMFPVLLMGTNNLHAPLTKLVHGLSLLLGRVVSEKTRRNRRWKTCFHHVSQPDIKLSKLLIPESMSEYEREVAPSCLRSHMHPVVHYPKCVHKFGSLNGCWMFGDERRNKVSHQTFYL